MNSILRFFNNHLHRFIMTDGDATITGRKAWVISPIVCFVLRSVISRVSITSTIEISSYNHYDGEFFHLDDEDTKIARKHWSFTIWYRLFFLLTENRYSSLERFVSLYSWMRRTSRYPLIHPYSHGFSLKTVSLHLPSIIEWTNYNFPRFGCYTNETVHCVRHWIETVSYSPEYQSINLERIHSNYFNICK